MSADKGSRPDRSPERRGPLLSTRSDYKGGYIQHRLGPVVLVGGGLVRGCLEVEKSGSFSGDDGRRRRVVQGRRLLNAKQSSEKGLQQGPGIFRRS